METAYCDHAQCYLFPNIKKYYQEKIPVIYHLVNVIKNKSSHNDHVKWLSLCVYLNILVKWDLRLHFLQHIILTCGTSLFAVVIYTGSLQFWQINLASGVPRNFLEGGCLTQNAKILTSLSDNFILFDSLTVFLIYTFLLIYK